MNGSGNTLSEDSDYAPNPDRAIWVDGRKSEMRILPSKFEQNTAKAAAAEKHSLSAKSAGQP